MTSLAVVPTSAKPTPVRRGIKTSEFIVTLVSLLGLLGTNIASSIGVANVTPTELSVFRLASLVVGGLLSAFYLKGRVVLKQAELLSAWHWFEHNSTTIATDLGTITSIDPQVFEQLIAEIEKLVPLLAGLPVLAAPAKANLDLATTSDLVDELQKRLARSTAATSGPIGLSTS